MKETELVLLRMTETGVTREVLGRFSTAEDLGTALALMSRNSPAPLVFDRYVTAHEGRNILVFDEGFTVSGRVVIMLMPVPTFVV